MRTDSKSSTTGAGKGFHGGRKVDLKKWDTNWELAFGKKGTKVGVKGGSKPRLETKLPLRVEDSNPS